MHQSTQLSAPRASGSEKIKVMLVDDSAVVRGLMSRWLEPEANIEIVARSRNGLHALKDAEQTKPDIIVLDIEMPEMDGLEALPLLLKASPGVRILIASSLSQRNAKISLTALSKGAHDYVPKPSTNSGLTTSDDFRSELITKINALCGSPGASQAAAAPRPAVARTPTPDAPRVKAPITPSFGKNEADGSGSLIRPFNNRKPEILCIGSSTGGPRAVQTLLAGLAPALRSIPVVITQHMPKAFTSVFAEHLEKASGLKVSEASDGEAVKAGQIYVAPGDRHMLFKRGTAGLEVVLDDGPEVNFCKPAVDCMFDSAVQLFGASTLGVVMTGMGNDGAKGSESIVGAGGNVIVQDEASSIVWGMPGACYKAGVCAGVFPLDDLAGKLTRIIREGRL
ncbi:MAG: chemotaxis response regulator protein-glutamate methylesterase [Pseudomonadota bacterium]